MMEDENAGMMEAVGAFIWLNRRVRAYNACDGTTRAVGKVIAYRHAPTVVIATEDGRREQLHWPIDLCEELGEES